jgi:VanZ family protein
MTRERSLLLGVRCVSWTLALIILALSVVPPTSRPVTSAGHSLEHLAIFLAFGLAYGVAYQRTPMRTLVQVLLFACLIELVQVFVPGRHARILDIGLDGGAGAAGWLVALLLVRSCQAIQIDRPASTS